MKAYKEFDKDKDYKKFSEQLKKEQANLSKYEQFGDEKKVEKCKKSISETLDLLLDETIEKNKLIQQFFDFVRGEPNKDKLILIDKLIKGDTWDDIAVRYNYSPSGIYNKRKALYKKLLEKFGKE